MAAFRFQDTQIHLDFEGVLFDLPATMATAEIIRKWGAEAQKKTREIPADENGVKSVTEFLLDGIDAVLGEGAADAIFHGREPDMFNCLHIMKYITDEYNDYYETQKALIPPTPMNRAQRRAVRPAAQSVPDVESAKRALKAAGYEFTD